jgi:hypothetical protein
MTSFETDFQAEKQEHKIMELRHDCSGPEENPTIESELLTDFVFR